ncbi:MAG: thioredoxin family protein [Candidatus Heimdallarchaeota archaeon]|nr:thioredoxin family protein [Candidatus Heimdallarchaeota archaeon]
MKEPVTIKVFSSKNHCLFCNEMEALVKAVGELSNKIKIDHCNCDENDPMSKKYGIAHHPALAIDGDEDYGIRFFGVPAGKEFTTLIESIMLISGRDPLLGPTALELIKKISKPVNLKVFVTLECPYCPAMVIRAQKLALASPLITAEMVEASQFAQLASDFDIFGVPNTIINNGQGNVEGLVTEEILLKQIIETMS